MVHFLISISYILLNTHITVASGLKKKRFKSIFSFLVTLFVLRLVCRIHIVHTYLYCILTIYFTQQFSQRTVVVLKKENNAHTKKINLRFPKVVFIFFEVSVN